MRNVLSPKEVALAIGVSESSLKRWADAGRIRVRRTAGGHRRIAIQEAIRFARENGFPVVRPDLLDLPEVGLTKRPNAELASLSDVFYEKLNEGSAEEVRAMLLELYLSGRPLSEVFDGPIRAAMERIGEEWRHGESGIYVEHRATDICIQAVTMVRGLISGDSNAGPDADQDRPVAIGGSPSHDPYILPSLMAATVLADLGFREVNLGPETPMRAMIAAARHYRPELVWLSCSVIDAVPPTGDIEGLASTVREWDGKVILGGRGFDEKRPIKVEGVRFVSSMAMLAHAAGETARPWARSTPHAASRANAADLPANAAFDIEIIE
ncbi:MAG: B12-binding domain-containing protein [Planctomycetota bacterium]